MAPKGRDMDTAEDGLASPIDTKWELPSMAGRIGLLATIAECDSLVRNIWDIHVIGSQSQFGTLVTL